MTNIIGNILTINLILLQFFVRFYNTVPQKNLGDRAFYWPRGRVWGGSSALNAMVYVRGHPYDYDRWESEGATGWSYKYIFFSFRFFMKNIL